MKVSKMIKDAIEKKNYKNLKAAAQALGLSSELLRVIINKGHIPKDTTLARLAKRLDLEMPVLVLAAHQEKVPQEVKGYFLTPTPARTSRQKRKFPLSEEQTDYLGRILSVEEIMMLRKIRQVTEEGRTQISGFVDYLYASRRVA